MSAFVKDMATTPGSVAALAPDADRMMELAIQQGEAGVAALERLVAMRERAEDRAAARWYAEAIAQFQQSCPVVSRNSRGAHSAAYATLDHIMDTIRPFLRDAGLSVTFDSEDMDDGRLKVWAVVHHRMGHSERASFTVTREKASGRMNAAQADGSAMSYARRYALCLALGISTGDRDDDGRGAGMPEEPRITEEQAATLAALAEEVGADVPKFLQWMRAESFANIAASRYRKAVHGLEQKR